MDNLVLDALVALDDAERALSRLKRAEKKVSKAKSTKSSHSRKLTPEEETRVRAFFRERSKFLEWEYKKIHEGFFKGSAF